MFAIIGTRNQRISFWTPSGFGALALASVYNNYCDAETQAFKLVPHFNHMSNKRSIAVIQLKEDEVFSTQRKC